jgi:cell division protein FtsL
MSRLNLIGLMAVMLSAFYLVHTQYESRRLYTQLDRAHAQAKRLDAEHEQLVLEKRAQATSARVQHIAISQLNMRAANPAITYFVTADANQTRMTDSREASQPEPDYRPQSVEAPVRRGVPRP